MATPPPEQKKGIFGSKPDVTPISGAPAMHQEFNKLNTRLRISEERYVDLRKKISLLEQNMLSQQKKSANEIRSLAGDILDLKRAINDIQNKVLLVIKEMQLTAKSEDVDVLRKYLEFWDPIKFVTMNQVENMIREAMENRKQASHPSPQQKKQPLNNEHTVV